MNLLISFLLVLSMGCTFRAQSGSKLHSESQHDFGFDLKNISTLDNYLNGSGLPSDFTRATLVDTASNEVWTVPVLEGAFQIFAGPALNERDCVLYLSASHSIRIRMRWSRVRSWDPLNYYGIDQWTQEIPVPDPALDLKRIVILNDLFIQGEADRNATTGKWMYPVRGYEVVNLRNATQMSEQTTAISNVGQFSFFVSPNVGDRMMLTFSGGTASGKVELEFTYLRPEPQEPISLEALGVIRH